MLPEYHSPNHERWVYCTREVDLAAGPDALHAVKAAVHLLEGDVMDVEHYSNAIVVRYKVPATPKRRSRS